MPYIVRKDLTEQDLLIPVLNTDEYYGNEEMKDLTFIGWVNEVTYEDDPDGSIAKFQHKKRHPVLLYSIDLDWVDEEA